MKLFRGFGALAATACAVAAIAVIGIVATAVTLVLLPLVSLAVWSLGASPFKAWKERSRGDAFAARIHRTGAPWAAAWRRTFKDLAGAAAREFPLHFRTRRDARVSNAYLISSANS